MTIMTRTRSSRASVCFSCATALVLLFLMGSSMSCKPPSTHVSSSASPASSAGALQVTCVITPKYDVKTEVGILGLPKLLLATPKGDVIAAGNGEILDDAGSAYAACISRDGTMAWSHWFKPLEIAQRPHIQPIEQQPEYACGVAMEDGSVFLGGIHFFTKGANKGLLTHLASDGHLAGGGVLIPKKMGTHRGTVRFLDASRLGEKAVFMAHVRDVIAFISNEHPDGIIEQTFWVLALNPDGTTAWEKMLSVPKDFYIDVMRCRMLTLKDEGVVVVAEATTTSAAGMDTLMIKLNTQGEEVKRQMMHDRTMFVSSAGQDAIFQKLNIGKGGHPQITTYDKDFSQVKTEVFQEWPVEGKFRPSAVHRTPEGYFFTASDALGRPHVVYAKDAASPMLSAYVGDPNTQASPRIWAATPTGKPGEFAVAPDVQSRHIVILQAPVTPPATKP